MVGRRPRRPLLVGAIGTFGYPVPCLLLALHAPVAAVAAGALLAGAGGAVNGTLGSNVQQQRVPPQMLARISAIKMTGSFALGSAGWAVIGPLSGVVGPTPLLAFAAAWAAVGSAVVVALPPIRSVTWQNSDHLAGGNRHHAAVAAEPAAQLLAVLSGRRGSRRPCGGPPRRRPDW